MPEELVFQADINHGGKLIVLPVNQYLQKIVSEDSPPRPFDYRIDPDKDWQLASWHLKQ